MHFATTFKAIAVATIFISGAVAAPQAADAATAASAASVADTETDTATLATATAMGGLNDPAVNAAAATDDEDGTLSTATAATATATATGVVNVNNPAVINAAAANNVETDTEVAAVPATQTDPALAAGETDTVVGAAETDTAAAAAETATAAGTVETATAASAATATDEVNAPVVNNPAAGEDGDTVTVQDAVQLATFWTGSRFRGDVLRGWGRVGQCVNIPTKFNDRVSSCKAANGFSCTIWMDADCQGEKFSFDYRKSARTLPSWVNNEMTSWKCVPLSSGNNNPYNGGPYNSY